MRFKLKLAPEAPEQDASLKIFYDPALLNYNRKSFDALVSSLEVHALHHTSANLLEDDGITPNLTKIRKRADLALNVKPNKKRATHVQLEIPSELPASDGNEPVPLIYFEISAVCSRKDIFSRPKGRREARVKMNETLKQEGYSPFVRQQICDLIFTPPFSE